MKMLLTRERPAPPRLAGLWDRLIAKFRRWMMEEER
jgi:hypothetical protein